MKAPQAAAKLAWLKKVEIKKLNVTLAMQKLNRKTKTTVGFDRSNTEPNCEVNEEIFRTYFRNRKLDQSIT